MIKKSVLMFVLLTGAAALAMAATQLEPAAPGKLESQIRHELLLAPHYGVFDILFFKLDGTDVTLLGQVLLPITRLEAEKRLARIAGIGKVTNQIEVLPLSRNDDQLRMRVYRRLFNTADLYRYGLGPNPSIHIIIKGGHLTLEGVVSNTSDKTFARMAAHQVAGLFSVTDRLEVEKI